ncbi:MAG: penicillin-binding protein activator LpoB [Endomicrobiales bacterium]|nr:penicillin-binding protein activator LpoB [Endomicrobiales bacterium]
MKKYLAFVLAVGVAFALSSCASTPKVTRVDVSEQIDLSGLWNDTDSQMVSAEMIQDVTNRPWIDDFAMKSQTKPRVIVGTILNKSHEHINTSTFIIDLEKELTNSGRVIFVASKDERSEVREEKVDQAQNASVQTAKSAGQEQGADFMLKGEINTIIDQAGKMQVRYYQINLQLVNILTNEKVWIGEKKIKKEIKRPSSTL